jgi:glycosyltransferase involved in cell wall biosynthesis
MTSLASAKTVVSSFLQRRYGGTLLRHGADSAVFVPERFDRRELRDKWGIKHDLRLILFSGTPSPYKGIDDLVEALDLLGFGDVRLLMAGKGDLSPKVAGKALHLGFLPHSAMPELLAMADLVVLPQRRHPVAEAQIPAKVFEAMAMAKPVIATAISDLPEILDGCGVIVPPEDPPRLAAAIDDVLSDDQQAAEMGARARQRHERHYSWDAMEAVLQQVLRTLA